MSRPQAPTRWVLEEALAQAVRTLEQEQSELSYWPDLAWDVCQSALAAQLGRRPDRSDVLLLVAWLNDEVCPG